MSKKKYSYFIGVLQNDGSTRFVTFVHPTEKYVRWESGKPALEFSMSCADDIVFGLLMNFIYAFTVKVPNGIQFHNPDSEICDDVVEN